MKISTSLTPRWSFSRCDFRENENQFLAERTRELDLRTCFKAWFLSNRYVLMIWCIFVFREIEICLWELKYLKIPEVVWRISQNHSDYSTESTFSSIYVYTQYHWVLMRICKCYNSRFTTLKWFLFVESNTDGTETAEEAYMAIRRENTDHLEDTTSRWCVVCFIVIIYVDQNVVHNLDMLLFYFFMN